MEWANTYITSNMYLHGELRNRKEQQQIIKENINIIPIPTNPMYQCFSRNFLAPIWNTQKVIISVVTSKLICNVLVLMENPLSFYIMSTHGHYHQYPTDEDPTAIPVLKIHGLPLSPPSRKTRHFDLFIQSRFSRSTQDIDIIYLCIC